MGEVREALRLLLTSTEYMLWAARAGNAIDAGKVAAEFAGARRRQPGSRYAQALVRLARLDPPPAPPPPVPLSVLSPVWRRDGVFVRSLSSFYGELRDAARAAGFSAVYVQLDHSADVEGNRRELGLIGPELRAKGWAICGWSTYGETSSPPHTDGVVHAAIRRELSLDGWIANGELWAEGASFGKSREWLRGWRDANGSGPVAVSCLSSTVPGWAREFDYRAWLEVEGAAIMPQVYGASDPGYTVANLLDVMGRARVPTNRLAPTFNVVGGNGPFSDYQRWIGPRSVWTGDDSTLATWAALTRT